MELLYAACVGLLVSCGVFFNTSLKNFSRGAGANNVFLCS
jgi:hypothetical protein